MFIVRTHFVVEGLPNGDKTFNADAGKAGQGAEFDSLVQDEHPLAGGGGDGLVRKQKVPDAEDQGAADEEVQKGEEPDVLSVEERKQGEEGQDHQQSEGEGSNEGEGHKESSKR